ncbi:MAG: ribosome silencing factor [Victivallaceae bacterium]|nr:ribosome silencing factor [Victivallaceae bacterium]
MADTTGRRPGAEELADFIIKCADDRKGEKITKLVLGEENSVADLFVVCSANSQPHLNALAGNIERAVREQWNLRARPQPGETGAGGWVVLDYNDVVVHLMTSEVRDRYNLEGLWSRADQSDSIEKLARMTPR